MDNLAIVICILISEARQEAQSTDIGSASPKEGGNRNRLGPQGG